MADFSSGQRRMSSPKIIAAAEKSARRRGSGVASASPSMQVQGAVGSRGNEQASSSSSSSSSAAVAAAAAASKKKSFSSKELAIAEARQYHKVEVSRKHIFEVRACVSSFAHVMLRRCHFLSTGSVQFNDARGLVVVAAYLGALLMPWLSIVGLLLPHEIAARPFHACGALITWPFRTLARRGRHRHRHRRLV
jgi:hypothetical protein